MPTRLIREGILESQRINLLTEEQEVFYRRLLSIVDDYGCYEAYPALLRARLYPLRLDAKNEAKIAELLNALTAAKLVFPYVAGGKPILQVLDFNQQTRSTRKHPCAPAKHLRTFVNSPFCLADAKHPLAAAHLVVVVFGVVCVVGDVVEDVVVVGAPAAAPTTTTVSSKERKPESVEAVIAYATSAGISEDEARAFFAYNEARAWKLPRGVASWVDLLPVWRDRADERAAAPRPPRKNSPGARGATPEAPFNPAKPHAHTGGIPVVN